MTFPSLAEWQLEAVRLAFVSTNPVSAADKGWWQMAVGVDPASITTQTAQKEHREVGVFEGLELGLSTRFNLIEWILRPSQSLLQVEGMPSIGTAADSLHRLNDIVQRWITASGVSFQRVAFCPAFFRPANDLGEATNIAASYVPSFKDLPVEDLFVQFNIPKKSDSFAEVRINRIMKVGPGQVQTISVGPLGPTFEGRFITRIEFDCNTSVERSVALPSHIFPQLLSEMQGEIVNAISKGIL